MTTIDLTPLSEALINFGTTASKAMDSLCGFNGIAINNDACITMDCAPREDSFEGKKLVCECCGGKIDRYNKTCLYCGTEYM